MGEKKDKQNNNCMWSYVTVPRYITSHLYIFDILNATSEQGTNHIASQRDKVFSIKTFHPPSCQMDIFLGFFRSLDKNDTKIRKATLLRVIMFSRRLSSWILWWDGRTVGDEATALRACWIALWVLVFKCKLILCEHSAQGASWLGVSIYNKNKKRVWEDGTTLSTERDETDLKSKNSCPHSNQSIVVSVRLNQTSVNLSHLSIFNKCDPNQKKEERKKLKLISVISHLLQHPSPWTQLCLMSSDSHLLINLPLGSQGTTEAWWELLSWQSWSKSQGALQQFCTGCITSCAVLEKLCWVGENNPHDVMVMSPGLS